MAHLKLKHNSILVLDPTYPEINEDDFKAKEDCKPLCGDVKEAIPSSAPKSLGREVVMRMFADSNHASEKATRRSRSGFMILMNMGVIQWYCKQQAIVEGAVFGAEFVCLKQGVECLKGTRCKLRMMGVPIDGPTWIYGDNMSVIHNTSTPESTPKKKSNAICYHLVREAVAAKECLTCWVPTLSNWADLLTKILSGQKRQRLVKNDLFDVYEDYQD